MLAGLRQTRRYINFGIDSLKTCENLPRTEAETGPVREREPEGSVIRIGPGRPFAIPFPHHKHGLPLMIPFQPTKNKYRNNMIFELKHNFCHHCIAGSEPIQK